LTKASRQPLATEGISICDVAPTLIAGPRMEWVMRNYATKFSEGFDDFPGLPSASRKSLAGLFLGSFDGSIPPAEREASEGKFLSAVRALRAPRAVRDAVEEWYGRIGEWFRCTVPSSPPGYEEVAEAVMFGAKGGRFLENPFLAITTLPPFSSFPPSPSPHRALRDGEPGTIVSSGNAAGLHRRLHEALAGKGARITSLSDAGLAPGQARIERTTIADGPKGHRGKSVDTQRRDLDLSYPRRVEPWLDNTLVGAPPPGFGVLLLGPVFDGKGILDFSTGEKRHVIAHAQKMIALVAESARAVRDGGHLVVVGPSETTGEGLLLLATLRQTVRTFLAEQHFLPAAKTIRVSLLAAPAPREERDLEREVLGILSGEQPPRIEPVPLGHFRP
jgi:hypothetical protein